MAPPLAAASPLSGSSLASLTATATLEACYPCHVQRHPSRAEHGPLDEGLRIARAAVVHTGRVIDRWRRVRACGVIGVEKMLIGLVPLDPVAFVLSKNLRRRHMTASQRAMAIAACTEWRPHGVWSRPAPGASLADDAGVTTEAMAHAAEVGERTIRQAKVVV